MNLQELIAKSHIQNERQDVCIACQGSCCHGMPGANLPSDFSSIDSLFEALVVRSHGLYSTDGLLHVRPASEPWEPVVELVHGPRVCKFSSEKGCALIFEDRPFICRSLIPNKVHCHFHYGLTVKEIIELVYGEWRNLQEKLKVFLEKLKESTI